MAQHPWQQQPDEPKIAFASFEQFLALGPMRTFSELARKLHRTPKNYSLMAARWHWLDRAAAWDRHRAEQEQTDLRQLRARAELIRQARELDRRDRVWSLAERILQVTLVMLERAAAGATWSGTGIAKVFVTVEKLLRVATEPFADAGASRTAAPLRVVGAFRLFDDLDDVAYNAEPTLAVSATESERELAATGTVPLARIAPRTASPSH